MAKTLLNSLKLNNFINLLAIVILITALMPLIFGIFYNSYNNLSDWLSPLKNQSFLISIKAMLITGVSATLLNNFGIWLIGYQIFKINLTTNIKLEKPLIFSIAMPHATFAIIMAFTLKPYGLVDRFLHQIMPSFDFTEFFGQDRFGILLIITLTLKTLPFSMWLFYGFINQLNIKQSYYVGQSLGYSNLAIWNKIIWFNIYQRLKIPTLLILIYNLNAIEDALIVGPYPQTASLWVLEKLTHYDQINVTIGEKASFLIVIISIITILLWLFIERLIIKLFHSKLLLNLKKHYVYDQIIELISYYLLWFVIMLPFFGVSLLLLYSIAEIWHYPNLIPSSFSLYYWISQLHSLAFPVVNTLIIAIFTNLIAIIICLFFLETLQKFTKKLILYILILPHILPILFFIIGMNVFFLKINLYANLMGVIWSHLIFVLPYLYFILYISYAKYNSNYDLTSYSFGKNKLQTFFTIKLAILRKHLIFALTIGISVSIVQYLPTLFVGGGLITTITIETLHLASDGSTAISAIASILQTLTASFCLYFMIFYNKKIS